MKVNVEKKCGTCRYSYICGDLTDTQRVNCSEWVQGNAQQDWEEQYSSKWGEMSYRKSWDPSNTPSMRERLRRGE